MSEHVCKPVLTGEAYGMTAACPCGRKWFRHNERGRVVTSIHPMPTFLLRRGGRA